LSWTLLMEKDGVANGKRLGVSNFSLLSALVGQKRLMLDTIFLGVVGALSAQAFTYMLKAVQALLLTGLTGYRPPGLPEEGGVLQQIIGPHGLWLIPLATTLGGLLSGILVYRLAPEAEGHGTDTAVKAFHRAAGFIRARVAPLKMIASAITIGSGGSAGREGPIALISAGVGSVYASVEHRPEEERRLLVLIGMAAGLSAIFRSPIGTAFFAIEVLYSDIEFDASALLYTMIGSVVAYAVNGLFVGWQPLFNVPPELAISHFSEYLWYVVLGVGAGAVATLLPVAFYGLRDIFHALPVPSFIKPAIGGLGVGLLGMGLPHVLGGGYGWIQEAIDGRLTIGLMFLLVFAKTLALGLTVSSGGSGGVFAPSLFVGAMLGGFLAQIFHQPPAAFVIVGMAALFAGAARVPIATLLMVTEMTGGYHLLVPSGLAVMMSNIVQVALSSKLKYKTLYEAQVPGRADSPAHQAEQVEAALHLLSVRGVCPMSPGLCLDLGVLLEAGIQFDLPAGKRLAIGTLKSETPYKGKQIASCFPFAGMNDVEIVAVFRQGQTLLPHSGLTLQAEDQLLIIASHQDLDRLSKDLILESGK
jgi:CIC family chloride channel protein